jgi:hypothetical protein
LRGRVGGENIDEVKHIGSFFAYMGINRIGGVAG